MRFGSSAGALVSLLIYFLFVRRLSVRSLMMGAALVPVSFGRTQLILVARANIALGVSD